MNNEVIATLLMPLFVVGLVCGIVVYPFYRNWLISRKGYDADTYSWAWLCGVLSFGALLLIEVNVFLGLIAFAALIVAGGFLRKGKLGLVHGLMITFAQGFSLPGRILMFIISMIFSAFTHTERQGRKTNADISKARAWETYQKNISNAKTEDGIVAAKVQYKEDMSTIKAAHGEAARDD